MITCTRSPERTRRYVAGLALAVGASLVAACGAPSSLEDIGTRVRIVKAQLLPGASIRTRPLVYQEKEPDTGNVCYKIDEDSTDVNTIENADSLAILRNHDAEDVDANAPWYRLSTKSFVGHDAQAIRENCEGPVYVSIKALVSDPKPAINNVPLLPIPQN